MTFHSSILVLSLLAAPVIGTLANGPDSEGGDPKSNTHVVILGKDAAIEDFPADAVYEEGDMVNGQKTGLWKRYFASGTVRSEVNYSEGAAFGEYRIYSEVGHLVEEGRWEYGVNVGHLRRYWPNGTMQQMLTFDTRGVGQGLQRYFHDNGQLEMLVELVNGQEQGDLVRLDRDGRVVSRTTYSSGRIVQRAD